MKTKNMRKKALLASVAMLLVAVVALGGATYAWFTTQTTVGLSEISLSTNAASALEITDYVADTSGLTEDDWGNEIVFSNSANTLVPMSSVNGTNFYTVTTAAPAAVDNPNPTHNDFLVTGLGTGTPVSIKALVRCKESSKAIVCKSFTWTTDGTNDALWSGLRCAVYVDGVNKGVYVPSGDDKTAVKVISGIPGSGTPSTTVTVGDLYDGDNIGGISFGTITQKGASDAIVSSTTAKQIYSVEFKFWLEGNNTKNDVIGLTLSDIGILLGTL